VRILSTWQLQQGQNASAPGIGLDTAIVFKQDSDGGVARELQAGLMNRSATIFSSEFQPVLIGAPRIAAQGLSGCFITSTDCGVHGTLYPLPAGGCTCVCDLGWENAGQPMASPFYCAGERSGGELSQVQALRSTALC
jgi:hypothetical protein